jgi:hypothetical protein
MNRNHPSIMLTVAQRELYDWLQERMVADTPTIAMTQRSVNHHPVVSIKGRINRPEREKCVTCHREHTGGFDYLVVEVKWANNALRSVSVLGDGRFPRSPHRRDRASIAWAKRKVQEFRGEIEPGNSHIVPIGACAVEVS